jgi:regulatory protein
VNRKTVNITPFAALEKIKKWCAWQERSQNETRLKLLQYGLNAEEADSIIATLISENFLNEERFATSFTSGKFRIKNWGKNKIRNELRKHKVTEQCINKALQVIGDTEYENALEKVIDKRKKISKGSNEAKEYYGLLNYAVGKGYDADLVKKKLKTPSEYF